MDQHNQSLVMGRLKSVNTYLEASLKKWGGLSNVFPLSTPVEETNFNCFYSVFGKPEVLVYYKVLRLFYYKYLPHGIWMPVQYVYHIYGTKFPNDVKVKEADIYTFFTDWSTKMWAVPHGSQVPTTPGLKLGEKISVQGDTLICIRFD